MNAEQQPMLRIFIMLADNFGKYPNRFTTISNCFAAATRQNGELASANNKPKSKQNQSNTEKKVKKTNIHHKK